MYETGIHGWLAALRPSPLFNEYVFLFPFKPGQIIYETDRHRRVVRTNRVVSVCFRIDGSSGAHIGEISNQFMVPSWTHLIHSSDVGVTVFTTRERADEALNKWIMSEEGGQE